MILHVYQYYTETLDYSEFSDLRIYNIKNDYGVTATGCAHERVVVCSGRASVQRPEFRWVNTILGNIKSALRGTYHAIRPKYAQRYLSEFEYRFNRRFGLPNIIPRLGYVAPRTPPMPERLLKLRLA